MPSPHSNPAETDGLKLIFFTIPPGTLLQLGTGVMLVGILAAKAATETIQAIGQASEEIFRGDRLPELEFPVETESETS